jgi:hypothetical protein
VREENSISVRAAKVAARITSARVVLALAAHSQTADLARSHTTAPTGDESAGQDCDYFLDSQTRTEAVVFVYSCYCLLFGASLVRSSEILWKYYLIYFPLGSLMNTAGFSFEGATSHLKYPFLSNWNTSSTFRSHTLQSAIAVLTNFVTFVSFSIH